MKETTADKLIKENDLMHMYNKLPATKQVPILYAALDFMQQYNGRTKNYCIFRAMGYDNTEGEYNTWFKHS